MFWDKVDDFLTEIQKAATGDNAEANVAWCQKIDSDIDAVAMAMDTATSVLADDSDDAGGDVLTTGSVLELRDVQDLPALFVFLEKCPTLRELIITKIVRQVHIEAITIPPSWLPYFAKRPLRKVSLLGAEARDWQGRDASVDFFPTLRPLTPTALAALTQSTAQITELHVPQHVYFAVPLHKHLARLEVLGLAYRHPNFFQGPAHGHFSEHDLDGAITAICAEWPSSTPFHELRLDFGFVLASANTSVCDLQHQARLVDRLRPVSYF
ncbi:hypothetical protein GGX14DRAFT_593288 [Mycena pura]|uniref:Uncharacterized protein n=1 Tax=Mycena pura TaxID=153505 RepID=A0AAD6UYL7_9AGAR|nr:hypothetical protein GGX14DRAFT_593288 [Mycena pura]